MTYIIEYHNGLESNIIGHRPSLDEANQEISTRARLWGADESQFKIVPRLI